MRCVCCGRAISPKSAFTDKFNGTFGPICAVKLGLTKPAPKRKRKPSRFAIFASVAIKQETNQLDFFGVTQ